MTWRAVDIEIHRTKMRDRIFPAALVRVEEAAQEFDAWERREKENRQAKRGKGQNMKVQASRRKKAA